MNEKLKYAPGKPGFGSKGDRGEDGHQGLSMYFTDFEGITPIGDSRILARIQDTHDLWINGNVALPDNRVYITGDIFIDNEGKVYEINAETLSYEYKFANLNLGGFFTPLGANSSEGYQRYFNSNFGQKYIIDNVHTSSGAIDYSNAPADIYGIDPINFARIEFTDIKQTGALNAFTVYTIGSIEDNNALALVYHEATNSFRMGNLANDGSIRNTNLIFDVSTLRVTKQNGVNTFTPDTPTGTVLTNYEIAANSLFDPVFNPNPASFTSVTAVNDCSISWNLMDFTGDTTVKADLYFYEKIMQFDGSTFRSDASILRPLVFSNLPQTGSVKINKLRSTQTYPYEYYMKLTSNGWCRTSDYGYVFAGLLTVTPYTMYLDSSGAWIAGSIAFDVNSTVGWNTPTFATNPSTFLNITGVTHFGNDGSILLSATSNLGRTRTGIMRITPVVGPDVDVSIMQKGDITDVLSYSSQISSVTTPISYGNEDITVLDVSLRYLPTNSVVDINLAFTFQADNSQTAAGAKATPSAMVEIRTKSGSLLGTRSWDPPTYNILPGDNTTKYWSSTMGLASVPYASFPLRFTFTTAAQFGGSSATLEPDRDTRATMNAAVTIMYKSGSAIYVYPNPINVGNNVVYVP
jgi:hypothetical protein